MKPNFKQRIFSSAYFMVSISFKLYYSLVYRFALLKVVLKQFYACFFSVYCAIRNLPSVLLLEDSFDLFKSS